VLKNRAAAICNSRMTASKFGYMDKRQRAAQ
jgi:hypothetical protein